MGVRIYFAVGSAPNLCSDGFEEMSLLLSCLGFVVNVAKRPALCAIHTFLGVCLYSDTIVIGEVTLRSSPRSACYTWPLGVSIWGALLTVYPYRGFAHIMGKSTPDEVIRPHHACM